MWGTLGNKSQMWAASPVGKREDLEGAPPFPVVGKGGDFDFSVPSPSRLIPRTTRGKTKVKNPTLTSNGATLGWGTLEILAGDRDLCSPDGVRVGHPPNLRQMARQHLGNHPLGYEFDMFGILHEK